MISIMFCHDWFFKLVPVRCFAQVSFYQETSFVLARCLLLTGCLEQAEARLFGLVAAFEQVTLYGGAFASVGNLVAARLHHPIAQAHKDNNNQHTQIPVKSKADPTSHPKWAPPHCKHVLYFLGILLWWNKSRCSRLGFLPSLCPTKFIVWPECWAWWWHWW